MTTAIRLDFKGQAWALLAPAGRPWGAILPGRVCNAPQREHWDRSLWPSGRELLPPQRTHGGVLCGCWQTGRWGAQDHWQQPAPQLAEGRGQR